MEAEDPVDQIKTHFESVFHGVEEEQEMKKMEELIQSVEGVAEGEMFTVDEVAKAIGKGKRGKAVGLDGVPTEILQALTQDPTSLMAITQFFNGILRSGQITRDWDKSVGTLLPKVVPPLCPKDLRPIALASHISKAFARAILARLQGVLAVTGDKQFAARGRQPAEFLWSALQVVRKRGS